MKNLLLSILILTAFSGYSQQTESAEYFATFVVDTIATIDDYREIDNNMRHVEGVLVSRMDIPTNRYYVLFSADEMYDEMWFRQKFLDLGNYSIHCIQIGEKGVDTFVPVSKATCPELN